MFYIHQFSCISPQQTFEKVEFSNIHQPVNNQFKAVEPTYKSIPATALRRMSKVVRLGIGAALPILKNLSKPDGIIIGTANAGLEECFHFLKQIVDYKEGLLTPGSFVQSTPTALAAQLGLFGQNNNYNITHVHLGLAFENAVIDAVMLLKENKNGNYLLGAIDDISAYNYNLNFLAGRYKTDRFPMKDYYDSDTPGCIGGEGAAMFLVNNDPANAIAKFKAINTIHTSDVELLAEQLNLFLAANSKNDEVIDLLISGENGDNRLLKYYQRCEKTLPENTTVVRFKHLCGEYPSAVGFGIWLTCYILQHDTVPEIIVKTASQRTSFKNILIYNNYNGDQHSFMLISSVI